MGEREERLSWRVRGRFVEKQSFSFSTGLPINLKYESNIAKINKIFVYSRSLSLRLEAALKESS